jgi:hypothetical protein
MKLDEAKVEEILSQGLSVGLEDPTTGQVCIEAAICLALGLPLGDDPPCTAPAVRAYKIALNDALWSSPRARAVGMRNLLYAQIGTRGVLDEVRFVQRLAELTVRRLLPPVLREAGMDKAALICENDGSHKAAAGAAGAAKAAAWAAAAAESAESAAEAAARAAGAAESAEWAAEAAAESESATWAAESATWTAGAARVAAWAANAAQSDTGPDRYLLLSASLALEALAEQGFTPDSWRKTEWA